MHERNARASHRSNSSEGIQIPGKQVLPAFRHGINRKLRRQLAALAGKENAVRKLEIRTGLNNTICTALLKRTTGERGK